MEDTKKSSFKMPHSFLIIGAVLLLCTILTYVVPAGHYDRIEDPVTGRNLVLANTFQFVEQSPVSPFAMFMAIMEGMVDAADIIFFTFFSYGFMCMLIRVGAFDAGIGALIRRLKEKDKYILPILIWVFGFMGASFGMYEEAYGFIPVVMAIAIALGYDGLTGAVVVMGSVALGFAAAFVNPYTIAIAQAIAELPLFSGIFFRIMIFIVFMTVFTIYTMRYANKIKQDPKKSYVFGTDFTALSQLSKEEMVNKELTPRYKISLILFFLTIITFVGGAIKYGWYLYELSAIFIIMMFVIGVINNKTLSEICVIFVDISKDILFGVFIMGLARGILMVLQHGNIIDSVCYYLAEALKGRSGVFAAQAMLVFQNLLNFFIPSGSGQAATSMPIMVPLADLIGMNRQVACLAFQFGDGFSNLFWPTQAAVDCAVAGIALDRWYKFFAPLFGILLVLQAIFMAIAVAINYGPF